MKPLKPVMAALLAASSAVAALPGISRADAVNEADAMSALGQPAPPSGAPSVPTPDAVPTIAAVPACSPNDPKMQQPVDLIACLIANPVNKEVRKNIGERFARFMQDVNGPLKAESVAVQNAKNWPENVVKATKDKAGDVAVLYFVVGPEGGLPDWAKPYDKVLASSLGAELNPCLQKKMAHSKGTISDEDAKDAAAGFLYEAVESAKKILARGCGGAAKNKAKDSIGRHATTMPNTAMLPDRQNPADSGKVDRNYQEEGMYETGGARGMVKDPEDKGYRDLYMKIHSIRGEDNKVTNQVCVMDVTRSPKDGHLLDDALDGVNCVALPAGETTFSFRPGGRSYVLKVQDGRAVLRRAESKDGDGSKMLTAGTDYLMAARADQIRTASWVELGQPPKKYYTIAQGGSRASALFFSPDNPMTPALIGEVTEADGKKGATPITDKPGPDLGMIDGKPYHLEYDEATRRWTMTEGPGAPRKPKDSPAGGSSGTGQPSPELAKLIATTKKGGWNDANGDLDLGASGFAIVTDEKGVFHILAPGITTNNGELTLKDEKTKMRGAGKYVAFVAPGGSADYHDLAGLIAIANGEKGAQSLGAYSPDKDGEGKGSMSGVKDPVIALDILKNSMGMTVDGALKEKINETAAKMKAGYEIVGASHPAGTSLMMKDASQECHVLPKPFCQALGANGQPTDTTVEMPEEGASAYKGCGQGTYGGDQSKSVLTEGVTKNAAGTSGNDVCLYQTKSKSGNVLYSAVLRYTTPDDGGSAATKEVSLFDVGMTKPAAIQAQSLGTISNPNPEDPLKHTDTPAIEMVKNSDASKGAYALFHYAQDKVSPKNNCLGVVVWWGVKDSQEALAACRAGGFVPPVGWSPSTWSHALGF